MSHGQHKDSHQVIQKWFTNVYRCNQRINQKINAPKKCSKAPYQQQFKSITEKIKGTGNCNLFTLRNVQCANEGLHDFRVLTVECLTAQKMKFSIKDFLTICDQICSLLRIWSHLLKKFLMENFIFCAVSTSLLTSCYDIRSSLTSILCLDNRAKVSQRL